jgi:hypothetical protein
MKMVEIAKSHLFPMPTLVSKMREVPLLKTQVFEINSISITGWAANPTLSHDVQGKANLANMAHLSTLSPAGTPSHFEVCREADL